jgi:hypothetical protein
MGVESVTSWVTVRRFDQLGKLWNRIVLRILSNVLQLIFMLQIPSAYGEFGVRFMQ